MGHCGCPDVVLRFMPAAWNVAARRSSWQGRIARGGRISGQTACFWQKWGDFHLICPLNIHRAWAASALLWARKQLDRMGCGVSRPVPSALAAPSAKVPSHLQTFAEGAAALYPSSGFTIFPESGAYEVYAAATRGLLPCMKTAANSPELMARGVRCSVAAMALKKSTEFSIRKGSSLRQELSEILALPDSGEVRT